MRRAANFLVRNWPLKVGAILLATVLYSGLVLGQNIRTFEGTVPVENPRPPVDATLVSGIDPVTVIRFRAPLDVGVIAPDDFRASVDLSRIEPVAGGPPRTVPVTLIALDQRVQIVDFQPREVEIRLDPIAERELPINVTHGTVPEGLDVAPAQIDPPVVTIRGASSRVEVVVDVVARVPIDASALNIDRDVELVPVDATGNQVTNVELNPERARVRVAVARQLATRTLPVVPQLIGEPAPGYRISAVTVAPLIVTVSGEEATVSQLQAAPTDPIDVSGRTSDLEAVVGYGLPADVSVSGNDQVHVMLTIVEEEAAATLVIGLGQTGTPCECFYSVPAATVSVTLAGSATALQSVDPAALRATYDVTGLAPGSHSVAVSLVPPDGLEVAAISPVRILIGVQAAPTSPTP